MEAKGSVLTAAPDCVKPSIVMGVSIEGRPPVVIVQTPDPSQPESEPGIAKWITSVPEPAAHSPAAAPEAVSVLAVMIASCSVHLPSLAEVSSVLLTVIVAPLAAGARAAVTAKRKRSPVEP